jgi:hypothetical protein
VRTSNAFAARNATASASTLRSDPSTVHEGLRLAFFSDDRDESGSPPPATGGEPAVWGRRRWLMRAKRLVSLSLPTTAAPVRGLGRRACLCACVAASWACVPARFAPAVGHPSGGGAWQRGHGATQWRKHSSSRWRWWPCPIVEGGGQTMPYRV